MSDSPGRREVAHRLFAAEYDDATHEYSESDEERAPNYVVTPGGARVNRLFVVGVLTEVEQVSDDVLRARIADPTGAFVVYAGQYQPDAAAFLEAAEPPAFLAVTGKARTFSPEDSDRVYTSVRPESINEVDADTRDRWVVEAAESTLARVATFASALELDATGDRLRESLEASGVEPGLAAGIAVARDRYGTTEHYLAGLADVARDALRLVADEIDEVDVPAVGPADPGDRVVDFRRVAEGVPGAVVDLRAPDETPGAGDDSEAIPEAGGGSGATPESGGEPGSTPEPGGESGPATEQGGDAGEPAGGPATGDRDVSADETGAGVESPDPTDEESEPAPPDRDDSESDVGEFDSGTDDVGEFDSGTDDVGEFDSGTDDVGDFEPGEGLGGDGSEGEEPPAGDEPAEDESASGEPAGEAEVPDEVLDEEERERIEEEYGAEFSTGTEVEEPGEAGIEPEAGDVDPADEQPDTGEVADEGRGPAETDDVAGEAAGEADLDATLMERMEELDGGDGAEREALVAALVDELGVSESEVEDAIQDALMSGKCFEPEDGKLQPI